MPKGQRKTYTKEFKLSVVTLKKSGKFSPTEISKLMGVNRQTIYRWEKEYDTQKEDAFRDKSVLSGHLVSKIQKENEDLRMENEILKKAATYFANKNQKE